MIQSAVQLVAVLIAFTQGAPLSSVDDAPQTLENAEYNEHSDMIIPLRGRGVAAIRGNYYRWPNGTVPYEMTSSILPQHQTLIVEQMRYIENVTRANGVDCVLFRPKLVTDQYFIIVQNGSGCSATFGFNNGYSGSRYLNLMHGPPSSCMFTGTIQHELLHVLGFYHEQSRPDRDQYIAIQWANVQPSLRFNFDIFNYTDVDTLQTPYDYGSVMHYDRYAFAINYSAPTIITVQNTTAGIGQRVGMSPIDVLQVQRYYSCVPTPTPVPTTSTPSPSSTSSSSSPNSTSSSTFGASSTSGSPPPSSSSASTSPGSSPTSGTPSTSSTGSPSSSSASTSLGSSSTSGAPSTSSSGSPSSTIASTSRSSSPSSSSASTSPSPSSTSSASSTSGSASTSSTTASTSRSSSSTSPGSSTNASRSSSVSSTSGSPSPSSTSASSSTSPASSSTSRFPTSSSTGPMSNSSAGSSSSSSTTSRSSSASGSSAPNLRQPVTSAGQALTMHQPLPFILAGLLLTYFL